MKKKQSKKIGKIAVVGMAGVFPDAPDTVQFTDNIFNKKEAVIPVPDHRWPGPVSDFISSKGVENKAISNKAGLIQNFNFDPNGFLLDKDFLLNLDPVHQLVLHAGREAFLQCSHTRDQVEHTGVILAAIALPTDASCKFSFQTLLSKTPYNITPFNYSNASVVSFPAAVLASAMGFKAGCFTLDAACASSLYSIKLACEHLHLKKADIMIAGGVSRPDSLYTQIGFTQLQALSPTGKCSPFDINANGLVVGEGTGIVVLKRLEDAVAANDKIHAVICGTGASNDIEGTLVGPASEGQQRALWNAYNQASWSINDIQYIECHGSGTPVGDQVELSTIKAVLDKFNCSEKKIAIGSVKSNIGHLLTAAGAAGFIKTILSMGQKILPPSLNFTTPSPESLLNHSNIRVQEQCEDWIPENDQKIRKAGISAFGFGGINAHVLVEEYKPETSKHYLKAVEPEDQLRLVPCAIVGMGTIVKDCDNLAAFQNLVSGETKLQSGTPNPRWKNPEAPYESHQGYFIDELSIKLGEFRIPPNQMDDILPQHIFLLKAAKAALEDAGIQPRPDADAPLRKYMGCAIGIEFDYGATDFNLRWQVNKLDDQIKQAVSKPLTFNRTLGALGGIVASRVAREFKLGGPSFTLSAGMNSGIKTIETGINSLSAGETNVFICGCVDLAGDLRQFLLNDTAIQESTQTLPSEGAGAIILKPLEQAVKDKNKIYGVISGIGSSSGASVPGITPAESTSSLCSDSLETALKISETNLDELDLYEAGASGFTNDDAKALDSISLKNSRPFSGHISAVSETIGNTYGVSSLFSVISTALCLYNKSLPVSLKSVSDVQNSTSGNTIHKGKNQAANIRKACTSSITLDGCCSHIIMEEYTGEKHTIQHDIQLLTDEDIASNPEIKIKTNPMPVPDFVINAINLNSEPPARKMQSVKIDPLLISKSSNATAKAHQKFLDFTQGNMKTIEQQFSTLTQLTSQIISGRQDPISADNPDIQDSQPQVNKNIEPENVFLNREQCLEFAVGKAGNALGSDFDIIDTYPVRVRLPDEPLMLVDRIMGIQGEKLSLQSGTIITQHDVTENAWYLDGGRAPVCISIEAGQADLFLCSWLGIDHVVKGTRKYRLLDASVTFHRGLPVPGETIEYHIQIDRFLKQGDVYLFFFHYKGFINDHLLISMRDGCAGFFTEEEVENSGGIILKQEDTEPVKTHTDFKPLVPLQKENYPDDKVTALRNADLETAFGKEFKDIRLGQKMILPSGRMHLIDRVLEFDPSGGRYGLGSIIAQADIHPDDWFLTCHFIDDMVMPGTLMYECCAHALRIFTQRIGWISTDDNVYYDVLTNNESELKCRGPVTPETRKARYEIEIKQIGYNPEPYVIADAHMFSDDLRIVLYKDMGMRIIGITRDELESFWSNR